MSMQELDIPFDAIAFTPPTKHSGTNPKLMTFTGYFDQDNSGAADPLSKAMDACAEEINSALKRGDFKRIYIIGPAQSVYSKPRESFTAQTAYAQFSIMACVW